jgi:hypothetical protein
VAGCTGGAIWSEAAAGVMAGSARARRNTEMVREVHIVVDCIILVSGPGYGLDNGIREIVIDDFVFI